MSDWFAIEAIDEAIEETKDLLSPFDVREWLTLAVVILFTGGAGGFQLMNALVRGIGALSGAAGEGGSTAAMHQTSLAVGELTGVTGMAPSARVSLLVGLVTLTFFALVVAWFFVSAVMNFVFVDICRRKDVGILRYFGQHTGKGLAFLLFKGVMLFLLIASVVSPVVVLLTMSSDVSGLAVAGMVGLLFYGLFVFFVYGLVMNLTNDFVIVKMVEQDEGIVQALQTTFWTLKNHWKQLLVYLLVEFGLAIAIGMAMGMIVLLLMMVFMVVGGVLVVLAVLAGPAGMVVAVLLGIPLVVLLLVVVLMVRIPFTTFTRYFSIKVYEKLFSVELVEAAG